MSDTTDAPGLVIIGGGLAGAAAAAELRERGYDGPVVIVTEESDYPYERPPMSKGYLAGSTGFEDALVRAPQWYIDNHVSVRLATRAEPIDLDRNEVALSNGSSLAFEKLLIATGAAPRRLSVPGGERAVPLRTRRDADRLRERIGEGARVVVIGAGWIGLETSAAARSAGAEVTLVEAAEQPLLGVLGAEVGAVFADLHREKGVQVMLSATVEEITDDSVVVDGTSIPADVVVAGVGVQPNTALAERAGLAVDDGIVVDASLRTSHPDVFAAGDVASSYYPRYRRHVRVEHWANALNQGPAAARAMLGETVSYDRLPYFYTDQYDLGMEYTGWVPPERLAEARVVLSGDVAGRAFRAFWLLPDDGGWRPAAAMHVNLWDEGIEPLKQRVDAADLTDPDSLG
jgi:3-phenylpropionate/trans-cinnamate dioxygenase ferredoxin reductase subunit